MAPATAQQAADGRLADKRLGRPTNRPRDRAVFGLSAIIGFAYQFPQKRTLLSMRGISVISHNTIIIIISGLKP